MNEIEKARRTIRVDIEIARTYRQAIEARNQIGLTGALPWLEQLLPTVLFIRTMEIHDDALATALAARGDVLNGKNGRNTLKGRLLFCRKNWPNFNARLVTHADRRNVFAHTTTEHATWAELDRCVEDIEANLSAIHSIAEAIEAVRVVYERVSGDPSTGIVWDATSP